MQKEPFDQMIARFRAELAAAEAIVLEALTMNRPRVALVHPDGRARLLHRGTYGTAFRVTDLDQYGPVGHRDYSASDARGMAEEIRSAIRAGYAIRPVD